MKRSILLFIFLLTFGLAIAAVWLMYYAKTPLNIPSASREITIKPNSSVKSIANQLAAQGVIKQELPFVLLTKLLRKEASLQAGDYTLLPNISPYQLILSLNHGKSTQASFTLVEGKAFTQMRAKLEKNKHIKQTVKQLNESEILKLIGATETKAEGLFMPETFYFDEGTPDKVLYQRSYDLMKTKLNHLWQAKKVDLPYKTPYEALIMASIVEKETGQASERPLIAGVFINRLRIGMRLQTDPAVIYGMGEHYKGNITRKDLQTDTVYNTYTRAGLPPTPICMPSLAAIEAALHPSETKAIYFVAKGNGYHQFSQTLAEHNRAVARYLQQLRAK